MTPYTKDESTDLCQTRMEYGLAKGEIQAAKLLVPTPDGWIVFLIHSKILNEIHWHSLERRNSRIDDAKY